MSDDGDGFHRATSAEGDEGVGPTAGVATVALTAGRQCTVTGDGAAHDPSCEQRDGERGGAERHADDDIGDVVHPRYALANATNRASSTATIQATTLTSRRRTSSDDDGQADPQGERGRGVARRKLPVDGVESMRGTSGRLRSARKLAVRNTVTSSRSAPAMKTASRQRWSTSSTTHEATTATTGRVLAMNVTAPVRPLSQGVRRSANQRLTDSSQSPSRLFSATFVRSNPTTVKRADSPAQPAR